MLTFKNVNVNPKNRKTGDCSTRAIANLLGISWEEALKLQFDEAIKTKYDPTSREVTERVLAKFGYYKMKQPRQLDGLKYRIRNFDKVLSAKDMKNGVIVGCAHHYTVVRGGYIEDIWDCGGKTGGNYYAKL